MKPDPNDPIVGVAVRTTDGKIWTLPKPADHARVLHKIFAETGQPIVGVSGDDMGFVTKSGLFLRRRAGAHWALTIGQVKELKHPPLLYSDDLWTVGDPA